MTDDLKSALVTSVETAAAQAGLILLSATQGADFHGRPTALFQLGCPSPPSRGPTPPGTRCGLS